MRRMKPTTKAGIALALDIIAFIITSLILLGTTNICAILVFAILIYVFAYDAFQASVYLMNHLKK